MYWDDNKVTLSAT